jgi:hypothetical protein
MFDMFTSRNVKKIFEYPLSRPTTMSVFGLTQSELEPMIYRTRGEYANHYTTEAMSLIW